MCIRDSMKGITEIDSVRSVAADEFYADISWSKFFASDAGMDVLNHLEQFPTLEKCVENVSGAATVGEAYKIKEIVVDAGSEKCPSNSKKLVNTGTIDRYEFLWGKKNTRYLKGAYKFPIAKGSDLAAINKKRLSQSKSKKIIIAGMTKVLECVLDDGKCLAGKSTVIVYGPKGLPLEYILGILNSELISLWYQTKYKALTLAGGYLRIGTKQIRSIPIATGSKSQVSELIRLVRQRHSNVDEPEKAKTECEIDALVYKIYEFSEEALLRVKTELQADL